MTELQNPLELSAFLTSLKQSVFDSTDLLENLLEKDSKELLLEDNDVKNIISLLMYDAAVKENIKYSYLDDFDFSKEGKILLKNTNKQKVKSNLEFMKKYLEYRIEAPIDLASC